MKFIIFLTSLLVSISIFSATHKIAIDARNYLTNEIDITRLIVTHTKTIFDEDTSDSNGGGEWNVQVTESGSLATAVEAANSFVAEKFVQVCMNQLDGNAYGTETYAVVANTVENDLATKVQSNVVSLLGLRDRGVKNYSGNPDANMEVIKIYPGFMDNTNDYNAMTSDAGSKNIAKGILYGVQEHFGLTAFEPYTVVDTTDPTITINSPSEGLTVTTQTVIISGTVTDDTGVTIFKINNVDVTLTGNTFSKEITLVEGANSIQVYAEDASGNNSTKIRNVTYTPEDTTKPNINIVYPSYNATVAQQSISIRGKVTDDDSGVKYLKIDGANVTLDATGTFNYPVVLNQGLNTFQLEASDNNNNIEARDHKINYQPEATDSTPPVISVVSPSNNEVVNTQTINILGTVIDDSEISLFTINSRTVDLVNNEFNFQLNLSEGNNQISFYARDSFNNQETKTINVTYNPQATDTTPPVITISSHQNNEKVTNANITITGTITDTNQVSSLKINSNVVALTNNGGFSYNATLQIGENKFEFEALDDSNNKATKTFILYLEEHLNNGPEIIVISPLDGSVINEDNVDIKGTVRDSDGVKYLSINNYKVDVDAENKFSFNLPLTLGINQITLIAKDNIDNESEYNLSITYKEITTKKDDGGCNFQKNSNKNFTNISILLMIVFILYFRRKWKKINS